MSEEPTADWRLSPIKERDLVRDRRRERRRRWNVAFLVLASVGLCPVACLGSCMALGGAGGAWMPVATVGVLGLFVVALLGYFRDKNLAWERRAALRAEYGEVAGWLVEMTVYQGETISGRDVGVVWFEDDRLYFAGARTSFGLGAGDAPGRVLDGHTVLDGGPHLVLPLRARSEVGPLALGLRFVSPEPETDALATNESRFRLTLRGWLALPETKGQLPPLAPGPDLPSLLALQARAILATAVGPGLALLMLVSFLTIGAASVLMIVPVGMIMALWVPATSPRRCWRAVRDRRRLDASQ